MNAFKWWGFHLNKRKCNFNYIIKIEFRFRFTDKERKKKMEKKEWEYRPHLKNPFYLHNSRKYKTKITNYYIPLKFEWKANFSITNTQQSVLGRDEWKDNKCKQTGEKRKQINFDFSIKYLSQNIFYNIGLQINSLKIGMFFLLSFWFEKRDEMFVTWLRVFEFYSCRIYAL